MTTPDPTRTLRRTMRERGITLQQLADSVGVSMSAAWRWMRAEEAKRSRPDHITRLKIERLYGIPSSAWLTAQERREMLRADALSATGSD